MKQLQEVGIRPDILVLRTEREIPADMRRKIAQFCNVSVDAVIQSVDVPTIYEVPVKMHEQHLDEIVMRKMDVLVDGELDMKAWMHFLHKLDNATETVTIGLVGKYVELQDAYKSINEALLQAATYGDRRLNLVYIHSGETDRRQCGRETFRSGRCRCGSRIRTARYRRQVCGLEVAS